MASNITNEDIRGAKTIKAVYSSMFSLLKKHSFRKITIKEICEEALISRATFYTHFYDKYDLLAHWIPELWPMHVDANAPYEQIEMSVNGHMQESMEILKNLVSEADNETLDILFDFVLSTIDLTTKEGDDEEVYVKNIVLSNFYAGGTISYLLWQIKNKFPPNVPTMNRHFFDMILQFQDRQSK